ncbi:hypothetical protein MTO96_016042 [Rhipicephalus appendiculatus]
MIVSGAGNHFQGQHGCGNVSDITDEEIKEPPKSQFVTIFIYLVEREDFAATAAAEAASNAAARAAADTMTSFTF